VGYARWCESSTVPLPGRTAAPTPAVVFPLLVPPPTMQGCLAQTPLAASDGHQLQSSRPAPDAGSVPKACDIHQSGDCSARTTPPVSEPTASPGLPLPAALRAWRRVSPAHSSRLRSRIAASTCVESVRWRPRPLSQPRLLHKSSKACSRCVSASPESLRVRNSESSEKSKPGSVSSRLYAYFQSMRSRTAKASCRSDNPSLYCITVTRARREARFGWVPAPRKECDKHLIVINAAQLIAHVHVDMAFRVCCSSHASGFFGYRADLLRFH
jgi:hypothetical protein